MTARVAAKRGDKCCLYSVYVAKGWCINGSWDGLGGRIMFADPMLEKGVM